jgi:SWI/SNF-related matrix-associated actin-dependent regulator of chromatin subfamily D
MIAGQNPQTSMTPNQMATHQAALDRASDLAKRRSRKPTDKNMPEGIENIIVGDGVKT